MNHNFRKLNIWKESMLLVGETYKTVRDFPDFERYNLTSQLIRCSISIPSNIAEGSSKSTDRHFNKFLENSLGSAFEWETQLIVAFNENYLEEEKFNELTERVQQLQKMISRFQGGLDN